MSLSITKSPSGTLLFTENALKLGVNEQWFDTQSLADKGLIKKTMSGRGSVYFFNAPHTFSPMQANNEQSETLYAIRHYCRGGAIAKLSYDRFLYLSLQKTRCFQELKILQHLRENHVNVPMAVAAMVNKTGLFYQADIITEVIEHATELHELLLNQALPVKLWETIGKEVRKMHQLNVCHYDINVKNVLIQQHGSQAEVYLIDFDKCDTQASGKWQKENIERFKRSIDKQRKNNAKYYVNKEDWQSFLNGYHAT